MRRMIAAAILTALILAPPIRAQDEKRVTLPFDGPDVFCHVLYSKGLKPLTTFSDAVSDPANSMIIVFGDVRAKHIQDFPGADLKPFLDKGGSLFVATDYRFPLHDLAVSVTGMPVLRPEDQCFGGAPSCPWLEYDAPVMEDIKDPRTHPLFGLLQGKLATNGPSNLRVMTGSPLHGMLFFPRGGLQRKDFPKAAFGPPPVHLACSPKDAPPAGRAVIIAGHGMFMNGMMLQPDTDNLAFAINIVNWLRDGTKAAKRGQALLIVDGKAITDFDRNLTPPPPPIPMPTVAMLNRLLRGLEDEGFFHWGFKQLLGDQYERVVPMVFALGTCVLLLYGGKKFLEGRAILETGVPMMVGAPTVAGNTGPRTQQRRQALSRQADAGYEARSLAHLWLQSELGFTPEQWAMSDSLQARVSGFAWMRWRLQKQVAVVLQLANATSPLTVSRSQFAALVHSLPTLSRALQDGRLTLLLNGKEVRKIK